MGKVKLAFVGDIMLGDGFWTLGSGIRSKIREFGNNFLSNELQEYLKSHDIVFGNVESAVSDKGKRKYNLRSMDMRGEPCSAQRLADWGFTVVNVATNHILEHGIEAARDTVWHMKNAGLSVIGAGKNDEFSRGISSRDIKVNGNTFTFIGCCFRDEKYAYDGGGGFNELIEYICEIKNDERIIVLSLHWGNEFIDRPKREQKEMADKLFKAGVSLIVGHHSHVIHGIQKQDDCLIAYSLGNFIFGGQSRDTDWSIVLSVEIGRNKILGFSFVPIKNDADLRPQIATGEDMEFIEEEVIRRNSLVERSIDEWDSDIEYQDEIAALVQETSRNLRKLLLRNVRKMKMIYWPQVLMRPIQRRLGLW